MKNGNNPYYLERISTHLRRSLDLVKEASDDGKREFDHLAAELQTTFTEYGFCQTIDAIYEIGEATQRLNQLSLKLDNIEKEASGNADASISITELHDVIATQNGIQQAMTEANIAQMQSKFSNVNDRIEKLENNLSSATIKADSELFIQYLAAQHISNKPFVSEIYHCDSSDIINDHMIHPGTRAWYLEKLQRWLYKTEKRISFIGGKQGSGKTALSSAICKLHNHDVVARHFFDASTKDSTRNSLNGMIHQISHDLCLTVPEYLNYLDDKLSEKDVKAELSKSWKDSYELLLREPLQELYGVGKTASPNLKRKLIIIDGLDECKQDDWSDIKVFLSNFVKDFSSSLCVFVTVRSKFAGQVIPSVDQDLIEGFRFEDRAWVARHIKDIEIYLSSSLGAILSGEDERDTPNRAKADEFTLQNTIDELLKCSAGRFDYAIEVMEAFAKEMSGSGQFLSSLKKATTPLRREHGNTFEQKMSDFASPYRAYRDKEGRSGRRI